MPERNEILIGLNLFFMCLFLHGSIIQMLFRINLLLKCLFLHEGIMQILIVKIYFSHVWVFFLEYIMNTLISNCTSKILLTRQLLGVTDQTNGLSPLDGLHAATLLCLPLDKLNMSPQNCKLSIMMLHCVCSSALYLGQFLGEVFCLSFLLQPCFNNSGILIHLFHSF